VRIEVVGARSRADAVRVARQVANSPLVKTAFFGRDPNVGRIMAAAGSTGVTLDPARIELFINDVRVASRGMIVVGALEAAAAVMNQREYTVRMNLRTGDHNAFVTTSDLSFDYVKINAEYTT
jgi:glutamate N-acetyltransferase/amino-acid N-acetyltransferase